MPGRLPWRAESHSSATVCNGVAHSAKCYQIVLGIVAGVAAELFVVDLKIRHRAAQLTSPAITTQDLLP
jgi:hypothetical protein